MALETKGSRAVRSPHEKRARHGAEPSGSYVRIVQRSDSLRERVSGGFFLYVVLALGIGAWAVADYLERQVPVDRLSRFLTRRRLARVSPP